MVIILADFRLRLRQFSKSVWLFPVLLAIPLALFTGLKISGSSVGIYNSILYGKDHRDPNLVYGQPRGIRSDEWLVNTQLIIAQKNNDYKRINTNIGQGQDISLTGDAPYKEWSVIFKPHNFAFFVLPFENAFAFKWWLMAYLLMVSCYFFTLTLLKDKRLIASLIAIALFCSPFVQWWYAYGTLGSIYFALFIGIVLTKIIQEKRKKPRLLWGAVLSYLIVCFTLVLYPPFQIASALAISVFFVGYLLEQYSPKRKGELLKSLLYIAGATVIAGLVVLIFLKTRANAIELITNTVYPGKRESVSGGLNTLHIFGNHLSPLLQSDSRGANFYINQSEASGFIFVFPFLLLLSGYFLIKQRLIEKKTDWLLLLVNLGLIVSLARVFLPGFNVLYKPFLLHMVPPERLIIGIGLLAFMQIILIIRHWYLYKPRLNIPVIVLSILTTFVAFYLFGMYVIQHWPMFLNDHKLIWGSAGIMALFVGLLCIYRFTWALLVLVGFSVFSIYRINPLYRGMGSVVNSEIAQRIEAAAERNDGVWIVADNLITENFPSVNGAQSYAGVHLYPQLSLWKEADPAGSHNLTYNRYAHVSFLLNNDPAVGFNLMGMDNFQVTMDPCGKFAEKHNIDFVLATQPKIFSCLKLIDIVEYPSIHFYVYENPDNDQY